MKSNEAYKLGFVYTGMSARAGSSEWEREKERATEIKKLFKGADFRIVDERCQARYGTVMWKNIYGNEIFRKAQYYKPELVKKYIDEYNDRVAKIKAEYNAKLAKLQEEQKVQVELYEFMEGIRK